jgi:hypothetical protein
MHQYLIDTEFAVTNLLLLAIEEEKQLKEQKMQLATVEAKVRVHKLDFETSDMNEDFSEVYVMAAFSRMAKASKEAEVLQQEVAKLQASVGAHQQATQAIAGAVLQVAKQGISFVYGDLKTAPEGRKIGTAPIRDIIWHARNQALHYEEGSFSKSVTTLFTTLEHEQGNQFSLTTHAKQSRAKQILALLGWVDHGTYLRDMAVILP